MTDYTGFAQFYDRIMGDRGDEIARIRTYISRYLPGPSHFSSSAAGLAHCWPA